MCLGLALNHPRSTRFFCSLTSSMLQKQLHAVTPNSVDRIVLLTSRQAINAMIPNVRKIHLLFSPK